MRWIDPLRLRAVPAPRCLPWACVNIDLIAPDPYWYGPGLLPHARINLQRDGEHKLPVMFTPACAGIDLIPRLPGACQCFTPACVGSTQCIRYFSSNSSSVYSRMRWGSTMLPLSPVAARMAVYPAARIDLVKMWLSYQRWNVYTRMRGDRPAQAIVDRARKPRLPRKRGIDLNAYHGGVVLFGFTPHARIDPMHHIGGEGIISVTRMRGDRPQNTSVVASIAPFTPHAGDRPSKAHGDLGLDELYPTHAGDRPQTKRSLMF